MMTRGALGVGSEPSRVVWRCPNGAARPKAHGHRGEEHFFPYLHDCCRAAMSEEWSLDQLDARRDVFSPLPQEAQRAKTGCPQLMWPRGERDGQAIAPMSIVRAIDRGNLEEIKAWVAAGGDPNAKIGHQLIEPLRELLPPGNWYTSLLAHAAIEKFTDVIQFLLSRGARVNATTATEGCNLLWTPLYRAVGRTEAGDWSPLTFATVRLLLSHGADPNLASGHFPQCTPLTRMMMLPRDPPAPQVDLDLTGLLPLVQMLLRAGADPEGRVEVLARKGRDHYRSLFDCHGRDYDNLTAQNYAAVADFLAEVRIAGSWPRYFLRPHMSCLVLRALSHRGRARFYLTTPTVLVRLFGAPPVRADAPELLGLDPRKPDLPDVVFWRVLTFMFGTAYDYPWVRPRLRARAAAAAAAAAAA